MEDIFIPPYFMPFTRLGKLAQENSLAKAKGLRLWHRAPNGIEIECLKAHRDPIYDRLRIVSTVAHLQKLDQA